MARERFYSKDVLGFNVDPEWSPEDPTAPVRVIGGPWAEGLKTVTVRSWMDITWQIGEHMSGVAFSVGATLESPLGDHPTIDVDLSLVGPLAVVADYSGCNRVIKTVRRGRDVDNGKPE